MEHDCAKNKYKMKKKAYSTVPVPIKRKVYKRSLKSNITASQKNAASHKVV